MIAAFPRAVWRTIRTGRVQPAQGCGSPVHPPVEGLDDEDPASRSSRSRIDGARDDRCGSPSLRCRLRPAQFLVALTRRLHCSPSRQLWVRRFGSFCRHGSKIHHAVLEAVHGCRRHRQLSGPAQGERQMEASRHANGQPTHLAPEQPQTSQLIHIRRSHWAPRRPSQPDADGQRTRPHSTRWSSSGSARSASLRVQYPHCALKSFRQDGTL